MFKVYQVDNTGIFFKFMAETTTFEGAQGIARALRELRAGAIVKVEDKYGREVKV